MADFTGEMTEIREIKERLDKLEARLEQLEVLQRSRVQCRFIGENERLPEGTECAMWLPDGTLITNFSIIGAGADE